MSDTIETYLIPDLKEGTMKKFMVMGHSILLARVKGRYFAVDAICPHLRRRPVSWDPERNNCHLSDAQFTV